VRLKFLQFCVGRRASSWWRMEFVFSFPGAPAAPVAAAAASRENMQPITRTKRYTDSLSEIGEKRAALRDLSNRDQQAEHEVVQVTESITGRFAFLTLSRLPLWRPPLLPYRKTCTFKPRTLQCLNSMTTSSEQTMRKWSSRNLCLVILPLTRRTMWLILMLGMAARFAL